MKKPITLCAVFCATTLLLQGCMSSWAEMQGGGKSYSNNSVLDGLFTKKVVDDSAPAQVGIVNHTGNYIHSASVRGDEVGGGGGGGMSAWGAGHANICCSSIPRVWHPGIKVLVRWNMPEGHTYRWKEKIVEVEKYDETGDIYLHFFANDEVRVVVANAAGYSRKHPIAPPPEQP